MCLSLLACHATSLSCFQTYKMQFRGVAIAASGGGVAIAVSGGGNPPSIPGSWHRFVNRSDTELWLSCILHRLCQTHQCWCQ